jgi:uncharacterized protein YbjQ (UPF0145 family)
MTAPLDPATTSLVEQTKRVFTSNLSTTDFALLQKVGFAPVGLVMGTSIYHVGWQPNARYQQGVELGVLSQAMYTARWNALSRLEAEAAALGADGVVGVYFHWRDHGEDSIEFIAVGTAIVHTTRPGDMRRPNGMPFTSHLTAQNFYTLLSTGHAPVSFVLGVCVYHVPYQNLRQQWRQIGQNVELSQWTQAYYDARQIAMGRMQGLAETDGATGVVEVFQEVSEWVWGRHTVEFYAAGTAIRAFPSSVPVLDPSFTISI